MKRIKIYTLLALMLMVGGVKTRAQEYVPFLQEGNEWNTLYVMTAGLFVESYTNYVNWCSGDTIVGGIRYTKLMGTTDGDNPRLFTLLREEGGKVWERLLNNQSEILLYDFSANVGDTLRIGYVAEEIILDSISIEQIGGVDRRKYWFELEYGFLGEPYAIETWIEGIGSSFGLLWSGSEGIVGGYYSALCFHQNGELVWQNPEYDACTVTAIKENKDSDIFIYPNPANNLVHINGVEAAEVQVYNALGQVVKTVRGTNDIDVSGLAEGVYLLRMTDKEGNSYLEKIVKQ